MSKVKQASILLLGAKSKERPLDAIPQELTRIESLFSHHQANAKNSTDFGIYHYPYFTQTHLISKLNQLQDKIAILHFAGHSSAEGVLTDDELVYSRHIAGHMASWNIPPALVVLNGCENAQ